MRSLPDLRAENEVPVLRPFLSVLAIAASAPWDFETDCSRPFRPDQAPEMEGAQGGKPRARLRV
jgi:hypothetical protein